MLLIPFILLLFAAVVAGIIDVEFPEGFSNNFCMI